MVTEDGAKISAQFTQLWSEPDKGSVVDSCLIGADLSEAGVHAPYTRSMKLLKACPMDEDDLRGRKEAITTQNIFHHSRHVQQP